MGTPLLNMILKIVERAKLFYIADSWQTLADTMHFAHQLLRCSCPFSEAVVRRPSTKTATKGDACAVAKMTTNDFVCHKKRLQCALVQLANILRKAGHMQEVNLARIN